jgi:copper chaperone CopZ
VYNIRGRNNIPVYNGIDSYESFEKVNIDYDTQIIDSATLENSAGVCRIVEESDNTHSYFKIRHFMIFPQEGLKAKL